MAVDDSSLAWRNAPPDADWFRSMAEGSGDVFFAIRTRPGRAVEFVSDGVADLIGHTPEELREDVGLLAQRIDPRDAERLENAFALEPGTRTVIELRWTRGDGRAVWTQVSVQIRARDKDEVVAEGIARDISSLRLAQQALEQSEEHHRLLVENAYDVIWTMALDGTITYVSPSVERVRGITPAEAAAQSLEEIHPAESAARVMDYYARLFEAIGSGSPLPRFHGEQEYFRKDGSIMIAELQVIPQVSPAGEVVQILGVSRDISDRRALEEELHRLAVTDPLTGACNRRRGDVILTEDIAEARRYGSALSLLIMDIDHFKQVNDSLGHQAGDRVLVELAARLSKSLRITDSLVRWGGEEFVVLMRNCTATDAIALGEKLRALVEAVPFPGVGTITISVGVAQLLPEEDRDLWLGRADRALYAAKAAGRNALRAAE